MEQQMQNYIEAGINERERCYNEITELEHLRDKYKELYESSMLSEATAKQYAEEVDKQNKELVATVEALRDTCSYWINQAKPSGDCSKSEYNAWLALGYQSNAMTKPAKQHLAKIKAQAVEDFIQFMYSQDNCQLCNSSLDIASKYADSILKGEVNDDPQ